LPRELDPKNLVDLSKLSIDLGEEDKSLIIIDPNVADESKDPLLDNKMLILDQGKILLSAINQNESLINSLIEHQDEPDISADNLA
jgi:hypothetical protein